MNLDDLIHEGRIRPEKIPALEIERALARAERDLRTAAKTMKDDSDWGFAIAYDAVLQAARAFMFARGFRPASSQGHKNVLLFMQVSLPDQADLIAYFDRMRVKRNQTIYDVAGQISDKDARALLRRAVDFVQFIRTRLGLWGNA